MHCVLDLLRNIARSWYRIVMSVAVACAHADPHQPATSRSDRWQSASTRECRLPHITPYTLAASSTHALWWCVRAST